MEIPPYPPQDEDEIECVFCDTASQLEALRVQVTFWKKCAQDALELWNKQEAVSIVLREQLVCACKIGQRLPGAIPGTVDMGLDALERLRSEAEAE